MAGSFDVHRVSVVAQAGIQSDTISELTAAAGVTVDGVLLKDGGLTLADAAVLKVDTINEATAAAGVTVDGVLLKDNSVTVGTAGSVSTDTIAEKTSGAGVTIDGLKVKDGAIVADKFVVATIAVADAPGGATTAALTLDLTRADGTVLTAAVQVFIDAVTTQYYADGSRGACTFGSATKGTIVASGAGWALVTTDADGEFDCTMTNASDETVYFSVRPAPAGNQTAGSGVFAVLSNSDAATWSA